MHADCILTDWVGNKSPFVIQYRSVFHIRDTVLRNMHLDAEIADVSFEGIVHFQNVSLANVTLQHGAVVSTTLNDYESAVGYDLEYSADDDANYDVPLRHVAIDERSAWAEDFLIANATMSDCVNLRARPETVYPGCPGDSIAGRERMHARIAIRRASGVDGGSDAEQPQEPDAAPSVDAPFGWSADYPFFDDQKPEYDDGSVIAHVEHTQEWGAEELREFPDRWFSERFLDVDSAWMSSVQEVLS